MGKSELEIKSVRVCFEDSQDKIRMTVLVGGTIGSGTHWIAGSFEEKMTQAAHNDRVHQAKWMENAMWIMRTSKMTMKWKF